VQRILPMGNRPISYDPQFLMHIPRGVQQYNPVHREYTLANIRSAHWPAFCDDGCQTYVGYVNQPTLLFQFSGC
jgi:hypothetical protein